MGLKEFELGLLLVFGGFDKDCGHLPHHFGVLDIFDRLLVVYVEAKASFLRKKIAYTSL